MFHIRYKYSTWGTDVFEEFDFTLSGAVSLRTTDNSSGNQTDTIVSLHHRTSGNQPWRQLQCVACHGYFSETHGMLFHGKQDSTAEVSEPTAAWRVRDRGGFYPKCVYNRHDSHTDVRANHAWETSEWQELRRSLQDYRRSP